MKAPERVRTERLVLRRPVAADADSIYSRYASDPAATRFMSWPRHGSLEQTRAFLEFSDAEWERWPAGPYLIESVSGSLIGSTGFCFETPQRAATGYILAPDCWGQGYATEALRAVIDIAASLRLRRLHALCHPELAASWRVLEKCGFEREGLLRGYAEFPNLGPDEPTDVLCYALTF